MAIASGSPTSLISATLVLPCAYSISSLGVPTRVTVEAPLISFRGITRVYGEGGGQVRALAGVDLQVRVVAPRPPSSAISVTSRPPPAPRATQTMP